MARVSRSGKNARWTADVVRQRIQASHIVQRLVDHVAGKIEMTATQIRAAEILLRKCIPDLSSVELSGSVEHHVINAQPLSQDDWAKAYTIEGQAEEVTA
jgi:hypothetical protein